MVSNLNLWAKWTENLWFCPGLKLRVSTLKATQLPIALVTLQTLFSNNCTYYAWELTVAVMGSNLAY